jgi:hypothetical protein
LAVGGAGNTWQRVSQLMPLLLLLLPLALRLSLIL